MDRTILHCDCNSFFASVECVFRPELKTVPMAVCGNPENRHGITRQLFRHQFLIDLLYIP